METAKRSFTSFDEAMRYSIELEDQQRKTTIDNDWWFASEMGMCRRKQFLRRFGFRVTDDKQFRIRFIGKDGTAMHEWRELAAEKTGILIEAEGKLKDPECRYSGRFDLLVKLNERPVIVDIKSQRPEAFFRRANKPLAQKVEHHQKMQISSYVYFLRKLRGMTDIEEGRIYYVDRGGGVREEFAFIFDDRQFKLVVDELDILNDHWKESRIPKKQKASWECKYCSFAKLCQTFDKNKIINAHDAQTLCNQSTPQKTLL